MPEMPLYNFLSANSFLEYAFLKWILAPAVTSEIATHVFPQCEVEVKGRTYRVDYELQGQERTVCVELDGYEFHGDRAAFSYDRMRQNDLQGTGRLVVRFSYDSIRLETARCIFQLQDILHSDPLLRTFLIAQPVIERPDMTPDPLHGLTPSPVMKESTSMSYFHTVRDKINRQTLRDCQSQAFAALANYYRSGGKNAACVMSVGAGKTALGVLACLAFTNRRALVVTPGRVIRGTFGRAFNHEAVGNVLYGLPNGPLIPGCRPPQVCTLDRDEGAIKNVTRTCCGPQTVTRGPTNKRILRPH